MIPCETLPMRFLLPLLVLLTAAAAPPPSLAGVWRNTHDTVRIRIAPCRGGLCGTVVSASAKAKADTAGAGAGRLIGTQLFRGFRWDAQDRRWHGTVHVPDIDRDFDGTLELQDPGTILATGCFLAGLACKSQHWRRVN